ncbi:M15 family metallopeptidase [Cellulomonas palmilytica]|uniref:M15 family metallopeptidase n=1 Tax=Cellulomonas palmilytica TaxID=2608402 RepID=UPI001F191A04|nr:M15 family metallopeptidase [Cellulomonas palmilytica]UJP39320.1 M15 family metallopeptidase [Cellulomonas palmilytica]
MATTNNDWRVVDEPAVTRVYLAADADGAQILTGDVAIALSWLVEQIHARVERVTKVNGWRSAAYNQQVGGAPGSNHMSGTAVDVNGHLHPYEAGKHSSTYGTGGWGTEGVKKVRQILAEAGGLFAWGLDYNPGWRDAMHFDIAKGKTARDVARFVATLTPAHEEDDDMPTPQEIAQAVWAYKPTGTDVDDIDTHKLLRRINANAQTAAQQATAAAADTAWDRKHGREGIVRLLREQGVKLSAVSGDITTILTNGGVPAEDAAALAAKILDGLGERLQQRSQS